VTGLRVQGMPVYHLFSSVVVVGVEDRPPLGDLGCALHHRPALVFRSLSTRLYTRMSFDMSVKGEDLSG